MLICRYQKNDNAVFISHIDILRALNRIIRRARVEIEFSKGFNPHALLFLSSPLPVGISSEAEYFCLSVNGIGAEDFKNVFNECASNGLKIISAFETLKNPNLALNLKRAEYFIPMNTDGMNFENLNDVISDEFIIEHKSKGEIKQKEVHSMIHQLNLVENGINATISCGNDNLRVDAFAKAFAKRFNKDFELSKIVKLKQFFFDESQVMLEADAYFAKG